MKRVIEMKGITKRFGSNLANDNIDFDLYEGETHALVGENGAGKTTLMRILFGQYSPDAGEVIVNGQKSPGTVAGMMKLGVGMVHQNFMQITDMSVLENVILGHAPGKGGFVDYRTARREVEQLCDRFRLKVSLHAPISSLCVGERQKIEIIKTLYQGARILILDEPTAVLTPQESQELFNIMEDLKKDGDSIIFISHKLREVVQVGDRITVMRHGRVTARLERGLADDKSIARAMIGKQEFSLLQNENAGQIGSPAFRAEHLWKIDGNGIPKVRDLSFDVGSGEILGIGGVEGNGQKELVDMIVGMTGVSGGRIYMGDTDVTRTSIGERRAMGLGFISEDRMTTGLSVNATLNENIVCGVERTKQFSNHSFLKTKDINANTNELIERFDIRGVSDPEKPIQGMSGGNLQKVVLAREISRSPKLLLAAQPTRGLDIGAINFVREQLLQQKEQGIAIILVTADLEELTSLSDRIIIMYEGRRSGEITDVTEVSEEEIGLMMGGITHRRSQEESV